MQHQIQKPLLQKTALNYFTIGYATHGFITLRFLTFFLNTVLLFKQTNKNQFEETYLCIHQWFTYTKRKEHMLPCFFSHADKHGRIQTVFRPRLRKIIEFCRTDVAINAGRFYWPESGNTSTLGTKTLTSPLVHSRHLQSFGKFLWIVGLGSALLRTAREKCLVLFLYV